MRLGLWNRLAIVAGTLFAFGGATWMVLSENIKRAGVHESGFSSCISRVGEPKSNLTYEFCRDLWLKTQSSAGWSEWWQTVAALAVGAAAIYLLIWAAVWLAKWVWQGRQQAL